MIFIEAIMTIYDHKFVSKTKMEDSPACACPVCSRNCVQEKNKLKGSKFSCFMVFFDFTKNHTSKRISLLLPNR
jgi:hypothetical protein